MARKLKIELIVDDKGSVKVKGFGNEAEKAARKGSKAFKDMDVSLSGLVKTLAGAYAVKQLADFTMGLIKSASDLEEVASKFGVVFRGQAAQAGRWSKTLVESYAMSSREAMQYLSSVQDLLVPMGMVSDAAGRMSNEVVKLSADLGSFNNLPTAKVMDDIMSGLVGNYETMKKYGVVLNATVVQQKALTMGLAATKEELTAGQKAQAAYKLMMEGSAAAIGDMARTSGSYANQVKKMKAQVEDLSAALGEELLPAATKVVKKLNEMIEGLRFAFGRSENEKRLTRYQNRLASLNEDLAEYDKKNWFQKIFSGDRDLLEQNIRSVEASILRLKKLMREEMAGPEGGGAALGIAPASSPAMPGKAATKDVFVDWVDGVYEAHLALEGLQKGVAEGLKESLGSIKDTEDQFMADKLNAYRTMHDTLRQYGIDDYEFRKSLIEKQTEEYRELLQGQADAEGLINEWRQAEMWRLAEERFEKEHEVMDALRQSWGLTWEEVRQGAVNAWQDIGQAMAAISHSIGAAFTDIVMGTKSAKKAAQDLFKSILKQAITTLIQIGVQNLVLAATNKAIQAANTAATVASMTAIAASAAPAAMMTSIATYGGSAAAGAAGFIAAMGAMSGAAMTTIASFSGLSAGASAGAAGGAAGRAGGGPVSAGRPYWVGERGLPELFVPGQSGHIYTDKQLARGEVSVGVQMVFHGDVKFDADMDDIRRNVGDAVVDALAGAVNG